MKEKNGKNYITTRKDVIIGNKKRSFFIIKPSSEKKSSSDNQVHKVIVKRATRSGGCRGCSRRKKSNSE